MTTPPQRTAPSGDIDRTSLALMVQRFQRHHQQRLARTGSRLMARQRRVLEALPMLYHRNHPALPGWVGADVPSGIAGFTPATFHLAALRRVAPGFQEPHLSRAQSDLHAVFIMGSGGTVGQSRGSDIDLWVCCDSLLHSALWPKVRMIDEWAGELGLELHTFLVDPDVLRRRRRLPGSRTPALLLDEFYRSSALMAGRYPLWWVVPEEDPAAYQAYAERLLQRRFVPADAVIDFGPVHAFPPGELAQAAIAELDRALLTPHKSLLKLKLMEAYGRAPDLGTVSAAYKARIHAGETSAMALDPYLLLYDHLAQYVEAHRPEDGRRDELAFLRSLLIGKTAENAWAARLPGLAAAEAGELLERFLNWGFSRVDIERFRNIKDWSMSDRLAEHQRIMAALNNGLELVEDLAERAGAPTPDSLDDPEHDHDRQLHWLNVTRLRHLRFAVARMNASSSRQIAQLHPALVNRRRPVPVHLNRSLDGWIARDTDGPVLHRRRLVDVVIWAELNAASLVPMSSDAHLTRNVAQILQGFRGSQRERYVFVNAETDLQGSDPGRADAGSSGRSGLLHLREDPLDYVTFQQMDLVSMDVLSRDSGGRWETHTLSTEAALLDGLGTLLASPVESVSWQVVGGQSRFLAAHRLEQLHAQASRILNTPAALFVLPFGSDTVTVRRLHGRTEVRRHDCLADLRAYVRDSGCATLGFDPASQRLKTLLRAG